MFFTTPILALAALAVPALAIPQSTSRFPPCISDCTDEFATSSWCDGDETGEDLANCTCQSLFGSLLLECMLECSPEDQGEYAQTINGSCRDNIFPDAVIDDDSNNDDDEENEEAATSGSPEPTGTDEEEPTPTEEEEEESSETGAAANLGVSAAVAVFAAMLL